MPLQYSRHTTLSVHEYFCFVLSLIRTPYTLIHCSELKRRQKADQKEKEKLEKAQNAVAAAKEKPASTKPEKLNEEEISPNEYFKLRTAAVAELKRSPETDPYPHKFHVSTSLEEFIEKYSNLKDGETLDDVKLR